MQISHVVVNASPLICLFKGGLSELLQKLFEGIVVPDAVRKEVLARRGSSYNLEPLLSRKWLKRAKSLPVPQNIASWDLGSGESAVLSYVLRHPGFWAILDDREARRCAASIGCSFTGTVGVIILAKRRGVIKSVRESIKRLQNAGLWMSKSFVEEVCAMAGE